MQEKSCAPLALHSEFVLICVSDSKSQVCRGWSCFPFHSVRVLRVGDELRLPCKSVSAVPKVGPGLGNGLIWLPAPLEQCASIEYDCPELVARIRSAGSAPRRVAGSWLTVLQHTARAHQC